MTDTVTGKVIAEHSYFSCCHCQAKIATTTLRSHEYGTCLNCEDGFGRGIRCNKPECRECLPFFKKLDAAESRERFRSQL